MAPGVFKYGNPGPNDPRALVDSGGGSKTSLNWKWSQRGPSNLTASPPTRRALASGVQSEWKNASEAQHF